MIKMNFKEHLANYALGNHGYSYLIQVAIAGLLDGYESEHLAMLAGEDEKSFNAHELNSYFEKALKELNIEIPTCEQSAKTVIAYWITQIIQVEVSPRHGVEHIIYDVHRSGNFYFKDSKCVGDFLHIGQLIGLYYTYDDLQEGYIDFKYRKASEKEAIEILDEEVFSEAQKYYETYIKK